jgi:hypothetical protein
MDYLEWNNAIGTRFFNPDRSGARVFLYVTNDIINEMGAPHGIGLSEFVSEVKAGPPWNTCQTKGICRQALQAFSNWRKRGLVYPPYLAYLGLFVLACQVESGFARHSYYPGLRLLLGEKPESGMYPRFDRLYHLWDDLALWSNQDKGGDWGIFDADIVGEWMHVGLPRAQTLLTDEERSNLPLQFAENYFDPSSPPSERELAFLLSNDSHHYLRPRTKELLRSTGKSDLPIRTALLEVILDELINWNGTIPAGIHSGEKSHNSLGHLRLSMNLDRTARKVRFFLRCRSKCEYPNEGLKLSGGPVQNHLFCYEDWQGWSTPLSESETRSGIFDPSKIDWQEGLSLIDHEHSWKTALSKHPVRVMVSAKPFGFDGFIEESQIPQGRPFYLLAQNNCTETIHKWGSTCCRGFSVVDITAGLPPGWQLYSVEDAHSDDYLRDAFPFLSFPTILRIQFRGGLKMRGNQYFVFALPQIEVTGAPEACNVFCNGLPLDRLPETGKYIIPDLKA